MRCLLAHNYRRFEGFYCFRIQGGKSTRCLLVRIRFLCHGEGSISTFQRLAVNILWEGGGGICHSHGYRIFCVKQYSNLILKCYMFRSKVIIMRRPSTRKYTIIDLHVTLANDVLDGIIFICVNDHLTRRVGVH